MSLVWALLLKYIKFDDDGDESSLSAKDALLHWVQFHTKVLVIAFVLRYQSRRLL